MKTGTGSTTRPAQLERIGQFLGEVGRRRVWRTALAYAAVVFVLLQLGEIIFPAFGAPDWGLRLLVVACFLGFPLVLVLSWAFDITSDGIQRTHSEEGLPNRAENSGTTLPRLALLAVILVTIGGVGWWTVQDTLRAQTPTPGGSSDGLVSAASLEAPILQVRSLAVLPLADFSEEEGGEYFTAGFHEELISQLSQIGAARVVSRTSVVQYDATGKTMPVIAAELGVEGVVEGSVFRDGNRVRITVQLIHGSTDQHLWANSYDGTLEDAIGLQRTVAQAIAKEIQAELFPDETWETPYNQSRRHPSRTRGVHEGPVRPVQGHAGIAGVGHRPLRGRSRGGFHFRSGVCRPGGSPLPSGVRVGRLPVGRPHDRPQNRGAIGDSLPAR